jgi:hypothetical protein
LVIAVSIYGQVDQTPVYAWTKTIKGQKSEVSGETSVKSITEDIQNILSKTDANSLIVYVRPSMTTTGLNEVLLNNNKIVNVLRKSHPKAIERSFTNAVGMSIMDEVKQVYNNARQVTITSQASLDELINEFADAPKPFINKVYIIELPFEQDSVFDDIVVQIEKAFEARTLSNHVSVLAGSSTTVRNLQESDVDPTGDEETVEAEELALYLTSNILLKNLLMIPLALFLIVAILQLFYIKTPILFVEKSIDFGKIEK